MTHSIRLAPRDLALLALLTLFWGLNWPVMKIGVQQMPPLSFRASSMIFGLPVLALMAKASGLSLRVPRRDWGELLILALTNMAIWYVLVMYGVMLLSSGRAAILGYTMPIWSAVVAILLFGEHPSRRLWFGVAGAACGVLLLLASEIGAITGSPLGTVLMLVAAAIWAYGTHRMRRRRQATPVLVITFWSLAISLVLCGGLALVFERDQMHWPTPPAWAAILYNAVLIFGFAQLVWFRLATILPPVASGLSVMLIPVIGVFSGVWILGERLAWQDWAALGCLLVAIGSVLLPARRPG